jgi:hypothetical protein
MNMNRTIEIVRTRGRRLMLQNSERFGYVTREDILRFAQEGRYVRVTDRATGADITNNVLLQAMSLSVLADEFDTKLLHEIIRKSPKALALVAGTAGKHVRPVEERQIQAIGDCTNADTDTQDGRDGDDRQRGHLDSAGSQG